jgi:hypothetical protein
MSITARNAETNMIAFDTGDRILQLSSIFFPQEKLGPDSFRPVFLCARHEDRKVG